MAQAWSLDTARQILEDWAQGRVSEATRKQGLGVQFEGIEAWILAQSPSTLEEAERVLSVLEAFEESEGRQTVKVMALLRGGECRRDGKPESRVSHSFAPRAYGPVGGRA